MVTEQMSGAAVTPADARSIVSRYEKMLLLRLVQVGEMVIAEAPGLARTTGFLDLWSIVEGLPLAELLPASRHPLVDDWVSCAECLLRNGIHLRYAEAHPARLLKDFSRVLVSCAGYLPSGASGRIELSGRNALQLLGGEAVLCCELRHAEGVLVWGVEDGILKIDAAGGDRILEADLRDSTCMERRDARWDLRRVAVVDGIRVDVWTPEYTGRPRLQEGELPLDSMRHAVAGLDEHTRGLVGAVGRSATFGSRDSSWLAGLLKLPQAGRVTPEALVEQACRDLVQRVVATIPVPELFFFNAIGRESELRTLFVDLAAPRLSCRVLGKGAAPDDASATWDRLVSRLLDFPSGEVILQQLGEATDRKPETVDGAQDPFLSMVALQERHQLILGRDLVLRKTRRGSAYGVNDWSFVNLLEPLPPEQLAELLGKAQTEMESCEEAAALAAATAYLLDRPDLCVTALLHCLAFDRDVEEYWHLLAFALRFLGRYEEFDDIVFRGRRDAVLRNLEPFRGVSGP